MIQCNLPLQHLPRDPDGYNSPSIEPPYIHVGTTSPFHRAAKAHWKLSLITHSQVWVEKASSYSREVGAVCNQVALLWLTARRIHSSTHPGRQTGADSSGSGSDLHHISLKMMAHANNAWELEICHHRGKRRMFFVPLF